MATALRTTGAIDRHDPDPTSPHDPTRAHIGMVSVHWTDSDGPNQRAAAVLLVATGRGSGDPLWGQCVLSLRWIGDPPPVEVAQAVYDRILDGGPGRRDLQSSLIAIPRTEAQPSYRVARA